MAAALGRSRAGTVALWKSQGGERRLAGSGDSAQRRAGRAREGEDRPSTRWPRGRERGTG